jgi:hypothetical protein
VISVALSAVFWFVLFKRKWSSDGFISSLMVLFYTFFPMIVTRVALTSSCRQYGDRPLLTEALSVTCWGEEHWWSIFAVGIPGLLFYVIAVPVGLARILIARRRNKMLYHWQDRYTPKWTLRYGFGESIVFYMCSRLQTELCSLI